jgi:protein disulfide-isomerase A6
LQVDATAETELASKYNVQGFPTIRFFPAGATSETESSLYEGPRELQAMVQYVNEKAGLHRTMFGTLLPVAGRVTALDDIITVCVSSFCCCPVSSHFIHHLLFATQAAKVVDKKLLARLETAVEGLTGRDAEHGRTYYLALGKRIVEKGVDYIGKEIARLTDLIDSPSVQPESRTGFQMKQNVLKAFVKAPPVPPR